MLRLSANISMMFTEWPIIERFAVAADYGFAAVEMQFPYAFKVEALERARAAAGVEVVLINMPAGDREAGELGLACIPEQRAAFRQLVEQALEYARALGCPRINCLSGHEDVPARQAEAWRTLRDNMLHAADICGRHGIMLLTEALNRVEQPYFLVNDLASADRLLDIVAHPNLKLQYDVYHARANGEDWLDALTRRIGRIGHVQISDYPGRHEPGTGDIDFAALFQILEEAAYSGWIGCEYSPSVHSQSSLGWREQYGFRSIQPAVATGRLSI